MTATTFDVVVVGAGFTGLSAAVALAEAGRSVAVVEARNRVGGKTDSAVAADGRRIDLGGQFLCDDMTELLALARAAGDEFVDVREAGLDVDLIAGRARPRPPGHGPFDEADAALTRLVDARPPTLPASAAEWCDASALEPTVASAARSLLESVWCHGLDDLALAPLLDWDARTPITDTEMQGVLRGSIHARALALAERLDTVVVGAPVDTIERHHDRAVVIAAGHRFTARRVLVAVPPPAVAGIGFVPELPVGARDAIASFEMGHVIKLVLRFEQAFWRPLGRSGIVRTIEPGGVYATSACGPAEPTMVLFVAGPAARRWSPLDPSQRLAAALRLLADAFESVVPEPVEVFEQEWAPDPFGGGGYCAVPLTSGVPDAVERLRRPVGVVQFASTELAPEFPGYVEGAIRAGRAAARQLLGSLATVGADVPV